MRREKSYKKDITEEENLEELVESSTTSVFPTKNNTQDNSRTLELILLQDAYRTETKIDPETGSAYEEYKLIKKNIRVKKTVFIDEISSLEEEINSKGTCYKNRVKVSIRGSEPVTAIGNYCKLKERIFNPTINPVGFQFY